MQLEVRDLLQSGVISRVCSGLDAVLADVAVSNMSSSCDPAALHLAATGRCPSFAWKDAIAPLLLLEGRRPWHNAPMTLLNCGANKGFAVADFLQRFSSRGCGHVRRCPTGREWAANVSAIKSNVMMSCGYCKDCREVPSFQGHVHSHVHAFEMLAQNAKLLELLFERFNVPGNVHSA